jgi:UDP-N-acetylglucosamine 2-epimerase (non-hydrolysing)
MKILHVVGARPNFMKIAPIMRAMAAYPSKFQQRLIHTGQHYDANMSKVFFDQLDLPKPDGYLGVGSGTHAVQTANIMLAFEEIVWNDPPDWVIVVGDVNSTLACALVSIKRGIKVAHVEAGLRSGDRSMPEEINRILTDQVADLLLTPSPDGDANLLREGIDPQRIHRVGNVMIDTLVYMLPKAKQRSIIADLRLQSRRYVLVTLHRPFNVDNSEKLYRIMIAIIAISRQWPVVFPVHPRTQHTLDKLNLRLEYSNIHLLKPLGYLDFLALLRCAGLVITDSGGLQEETTYLDVPCLTVRPNTERPITLELGTNQLVQEASSMLEKADEIILGQSKTSQPIPLWDGKASERIVDIFREFA